MADQIEGVGPKQEANLQKASENLNQAIEAFRSEHPQDALSPQSQEPDIFCPSSRAENLASSLNDAFSATGV
jgi:hypothetical protein